jgi:predicted transcriptional regulator
MRVTEVVLGRLLAGEQHYMEAISSDANDLTYNKNKPVLLAATSDTAMALGHETIEASGLRIGASEPIELAQDRIGRQVLADAVWLELDRDLGQAMDDLLTQVSHDVCDGRYAAVVSTTLALLDPVVARLKDSPVELIVNADEAERAAALAIAMAKRHDPPRVSDIGADKNAERLRQLSEEVSRIASTLARLSTGPAPALSIIENAVSTDVPDIPIHTVRSVIRARRLRSSYFPGDLFADPAWDMMLDLLQAEIAQLRVPVSSLCIAANVPATTALRWLKMMVAKDVFIRRSDPHDGRRVFVELTPQTSDALRRYFGEIGQTAAI